MDSKFKSSKRIEDFGDDMDAWLSWHRSHRIVAQMDEPQATKESREKLHDTSNASAVFPDWRNFMKELTDIVEKDANDYKEQFKIQAKSRFYDVICDYFTELTPEDFHDALVDAASKYLEDTRLEYEKCRKLHDYFLTGGTHNFK